MTDEKDCKTIGEKIGKGNPTTRRRGAEMVAAFFFLVRLGRISVLWASR